MKKIKRQLEIENYIQIKEHVLIDDLAERFKVNKITIHRDLTDLEEKGRIKKVLNGAIGIGRSIIATSHIFYKRASQNWNEKYEISKKALSFIKSGKLYFLDGSSTLLPFVQGLSMLDINNITVITTSIIFQLELSKNRNINLIGLGGGLHKDTFVSTGNYTWKYIEEFNADKLFFSSAGISKDLMITDKTSDHATNKKMFLKNSKTKIILLDHTKFEDSGHFIVDHIKNVDILIIGDNTKKKYLKKINKIGGLKIILVDVN